MLIGGQSHDDLHAPHLYEYENHPHYPTLQNTLSPAAHAQILLHILRFAAQAPTLTAYAPLYCTRSAILHTLCFPAHAPGQLQKISTDQKS